jgi:HlyD family secretion protein
MAKSRSSGGLIFTLIVVLGAAAGGWYYFAGRADKQPEYSTVKVTRGNITQTISATGNLQTTSQVTISSQVSGNVIAINADFNDIVKKGQWLLKIDPSTYQQRLRQATADLEAAKATAIKTRGDFARSKDLFAKNLISQSDYDTAVATLAQAESNLVSKQAAMENSQTDLDRCIIYSPIDGVILNRTIDVGATVNVNQSAVRPLHHHQRPHQAPDQRGRLRGRHRQCPGETDRPVFGGCLSEPSLPGRRVAGAQFRQEHQRRGHLLGHHRRG